MDLSIHFYDGRTRMFFIFTSFPSLVSSSVAKIILGFFGSNEIYTWRDKRRKETMKVFKETRNEEKSDRIITYDGNSQDK